MTYIFILRTKCQEVCCHKETKLQGPDVCVRKRDRERQRGALQGGEWEAQALPMAAPVH